MASENITHIRSDIASTKAHIAETLDEIESRTQAMKDWRNLIRSYPLASVLLAIGVGFMFSEGGIKAIKPPPNTINHAFWTAISAMIVKKSTQQQSGSRRPLFG